MPSLDLAMPLALFVVVTVAMFLNRKVEGKLMATVEEKVFKTRDVILLVVFMAVVISVIAYSSIVAPEQVLQNVFLLVFLGSYTMLLFTFSYVFSNMKKRNAQLISLGFGIVGVVAGAVSLIAPLNDAYTIYRAAAFFGLAIFCFGTIVFEEKKTNLKARWYIAAQPPAAFVLLFLLFNVFYAGAVDIWSPFLMDVFGFTFAILIILYLSSLFSWKTVGLFAILLTIMDIILVIVTPVMVTTATTFTKIGLPVLVYLPNVPLVYSETTGALLSRGLGLGDFFFAGILGSQTWKRFGKKTAIASLLTISVSFGLFELILLNPELRDALPVPALPATLPILLGWLPVVAVKMFAARGQTQKETLSPSQVQK